MILCQLLRLKHQDEIYIFLSSDCTVQGDDTMKGTCYTPDECNSLGGINRGNCASGFGVCCVIL